MKIFMTGATGIIGFTTARYLAARGHDVFGLARTQEKALQLAAAEIQPVLGSMNDPKSYYDVARHCQVLIHCAAEYSENYVTLDRLTMDTFFKAATEANLPRTIIYTSGVWVYGNTNYSKVDESSELKPIPITQARIETEKMVLQANKDNVSTLCVRPGCVYGGSGSLTSAWFDSAAKEGSARIVGDGDFAWAMIHIHDLAEGYTRLAESALGGHIFNFTDRSRFTVLECAQAVNRVMGINQPVKTSSVEDARKTMGGLADGIVLNQHVDSSKAVRLLGWQPMHSGFVDGIERYYSAWKALAKQ